MKCLPFGLLIVLVATVASVASAREWNDSTGKFSVEAELISTDGQTVKLRKTDGSTIEIQVDKLSAADQTFFASKKNDHPQPKPPHDPMEAALRNPTTIELADATLRDAVRMLQQLHRINIFIDKRALDDAGLGDDIPVSLSAKNKELESVLDQLLEPLALDWAIRDGVLMISTKEALELALQVKVYREKIEIDADETVKAIMSRISPDSWDQRGGSGSIAAVNDRYVVRQTFRIHRQIGKEFADKIQPVTSRGRSLSGSLNPAITALLPPDKADAIIRALGSPVHWDFDRTPLFDVVDFVRKDSSIEIDIDGESLKAIGLTQNMPISISVKGISLRSALKLLLQKIQCDWIADESGLHVTSAEAYAGKMIVGNYKVAGLDRNELLSLTEAIKSTIAPSQWDEVGGPGTITIEDERLSIEQSFANHIEIAGLLQQLKTD